MHERAQIDVKQMIEEAIQAKQAEVAARYAIIEPIPEGKALTWNVTPEQIAKINDGNREALDLFYLDSANYRRIKFCAYSYLRHNPYVKAVVSYEDLIQQVYHDLRIGLLKLRPYDGAICGAIFHSFRFAAVGGMDEIYIKKERKKCQKQVN